MNILLTDLSIMLQCIFNVKIQTIQNGGIKHACHQMKKKKHLMLLMWNFLFCWSSSRFHCIIQCTVTVHIEPRRNRSEMAVAKTYHSLLGKKDLCTTSLHYMSFALQNLWPSGLMNNGWTLLPDLHDRLLLLYFENAHMYLHISWSPLTTSCFAHWLP